MPILWGALSGAIGWLFRTELGRWIAGALVWLGVGLVTQSVLVGPGIEVIEGYMQGMSGAGATAVQWLGFLNFDKACTIVLSAYAARATVSAGKVFFSKRAA